MGITQTILFAGKDAEPFYRALDIAPNAAPEATVRKSGSETSVHLKQGQGYTEIAYGGDMIRITEADSDHKTRTFTVMEGDRLSIKKTTIRDNHTVTTRQQPIQDADGLQEDLQEARMATNNVLAEKGIIERPSPSMQSDAMTRLAAPVRSWLDACSDGALQGGERGVKMGSIGGLGTALFGAATGAALGCAAGIVFDGSSGETPNHGLPQIRQAPESNAR